MNQASTIAQQRIQLNFRIPLDLDKRLAIAAINASEGDGKVSKTDLVEKAIVAYLDQMDRRRGGKNV